MAKITDYQLYRLKVPMGRPIGDNIGVYESVTMVGLELRTNAGFAGWGFGLFVTEGKFSKPLPWLEKTPGLSELQRQFDASYWPLLSQSTPKAARKRTQSTSVFAGKNWFGGALQMSFWDLLGKEAGRPVYQLLGPHVNRDRVRAYGSGLCFHLSDEHAVAVYRRFADLGMTTVKVKVGHADPERDVHRLKLVRDVVGNKVDISVDANLAWTAQQAIERVRRYRDAGVPIIYVEDPMPDDDLEGYRTLASANETDIVAHDYTTDHARLQALLEAGVIDRVRCTYDLDNMIARDQLAQAFGRPSIISNAPFEIGIHLGVASPNVELIEFSDLAWNNLPINPVKIEEGFVFPPNQPGHGFEPRQEMLKLWQQNEVAGD